MIMPAPRYFYHTVRRTKPDTKPVRYVENFPSKYLLKRSVVFKFDKICQNIIVQNG